MNGKSIPGWLRRVRMRLSVSNLARECLDEQVKMLGLEHHGQAADLAIRAACLEDMRRLRDEDQRAIKAWQEA